MTITYRDAGGYVCEEMDYSAESQREINFCDGFAYFTSAEQDKDGSLIERKIPISALESIIY